MLLQYVGNKSLSAQDSKILDSSIFAQNKEYLAFLKEESLSL
jgi:hypothetical protein